MAVLINSSDYFITMLFTNSDVLPDDFAKHSVTNSKRHKILHKEQKYSTPVVERI